MKQLFILLLLLCVVFNTQASAGISGKVIHSETKLPLYNVYIQLFNTIQRNTYTDVEGQFDFKNLPAGTYYLSCSAIGYASTTDTFAISLGQTVTAIISMQEQPVELPDVIISSQKELSLTTINPIDFNLRPHNTTQDLLRMVPGLFIAQHAGGGKAEQIFLPGFDIDHGTDIAISVDGMPVNMVSHAHGQGYADLHFIIPETVDNMNFSKGCYDAQTGDFNTAGAVRFQTKNIVRQNLLKAEGGRFNTYRAMAMMNLISHKDSALNKHNAYVASEYFYSKGFFEYPQHLNRLNLFGKYHGRLSDHTYLTATASTFSSYWDASGQIPQRAVDSGTIGWYGAIDPSEGGKTSRSNLTASLLTKTVNAGTFKQQLYLIDYAFSLYSNFTFYKEDPVNGDAIHQYEHRNIFGYTTSYSNEYVFGKSVLKMNAGLGIRTDKINNTGLAHVRQRSFLNDIKKGSTNQSTLSAYTDATLLLSSRLTINAGLRYDYFLFNYESSIDDSASAKRQQGIASPKASIYFIPVKDVQLYLSGGYGFHSNDARVSVYRTANSSLPRAKSLDLGTNLKLWNRLFLNAAAWYMYLESEYVYVGDEGLLEPGGRTQRLGIDISSRLQVMKGLYLDLDINLAKPRYLDLPKGENYVPLAPMITSTAGLSAKHQQWSGSLRYRYIGNRPAVEDKSIIANGYFIVDAVINYQLRSFTIGISVENMLNKKWREAQFATESQLQTESVPVTEIHFTPGIPFFIKAMLSFTF